ncbi:MAG: universal stress protein [Chloroflexi bacterium]|nr:universal stress protein [Chloroflexota bacterium]MBV9896593.1 universal stress protein [Chloroflexota bacterium]
MVRTVVVPLDGSQLAERALPYAVRLAQASAARLVLMRAALAPPPQSLDGSDWEVLQSDALAEATRYLLETARTLSGQVSAVETIAPYGHAADKIIETIQRYDADAVVMATHGRTGFAHVLYGSVTESILSRSDVPVFAVYARPGEKPLAPLTPEKARLLVPQDGSAYDAPALQTALNMLGPGGEIVLMTVAEPPQHVERDESGRRVLAYLDQQEEARTREAREYLNSVLAELRNQDVHVPMKVDVRLGDPVSGILMAAIDSQADLIVMATHGRTGIRRAVLGSVAGQVLRTGRTPVVLVHPTQAQLAEPPIERRQAVGPVPTF